ncbi:MAG: ATP-binding protein [Bacteroidia bacterium]|nr:ATP-binding protein [Bacteroidia bacterium]
MSYNFTTLCFVRFISGIIAFGLAGLLWKRRYSRGAGYLLLFEVAAAIWAIGDGFEAAAITLPQKLHWSQISYIGVTTSAVMFFLFALSYTNFTRLVNQKTKLILMVIPVLTMMMAFTNPLHELLWSKIIIIEGTNQSVYYYGPWFWVNVVYEYSVLTFGIIVLLNGAFKVFSLYKVQIWILVIGTLLPFFTSILYIFKLTPLKGIDPTPISFILSGIIVAISLYWLRMFNIMPIARKQAIDNLSDGMLILDSANRIADANPAFCRELGKQPGEVIGNQADYCLSEIGISLGRFSSDNENTIEVQKGGEANRKNLEIKCHLVKDQNGKLIGRILMLTDITTKKMILDSIADSNNRRKAELIEKEKLILDLDAYARSVAHDLKNPISSVVSLSELIKISLSENRPDEAVELTGMVQNQSEKMVRIIDNLLILSRIRREDVMITPIDTNKILHEVMERLYVEINTRKATFEMPDNWPIVQGHNQWIEEVWVNLVSNALKYGGTPPVIKLGFEKEGSSTYRFWIRDNGNGLPEGSMVKIFEDFERLGRKDVQGHGLGLSIVKRIIEKLGGEVKVESSDKPLEGCIFSFTLKEVANNLS